MVKMEMGYGTDSALHRSPVHGIGRLRDYMESSPGLFKTKAY